MDNKVISLKDWVPAQVRAHFLTEDEVDTWNAEYNESQLAQNDAGSDSHHRETLTLDTEGVRTTETAPQE